MYRETIEEQLSCIKAKTKRQQLILIILSSVIVVLMILDFWVRTWYYFPMNPEMSEVTATVSEKHKYGPILVIKLKYDFRYKEYNVRGPSMNSLEVGDKFKILVNEYKPDVFLWQTE